MSLTNRLPFQGSAPSPGVAPSASGATFGAATSRNSNMGVATASSAHNMLKAIGLELAFVVVATMLAGMSDSWGSSMVALMLALLVLRGLFEVDLFASFASHTSLTPVR